MPAFSQVDSILALPIEQQHLALFNWYKNNITRDPRVMLPEMERIRDEFENQDQEYLSTMMQSLILYYQLKHTGLSSEMKLYLVNEAIKDGKRNGLDWMEAEGIFWRGEVLFEAREYGQGIEQMLKGLEWLEKEGWSNPFTGIYGYQSIGHGFYRFGDIEFAIRYLKLANQFNVPKTHVGYPYTSLNTLGLAYQQLMKYDSALYYYHLAREGAQFQHDSFWMGLITGNIGSLYFKTGQMDSAYTHLLTDYKTSIKSGILGSAANAGQLLANIELQRGNTRSAEAYIRFSRMHMDTANLEGMINYLTNMYAFSKLRNDFQKAVAYADTLQDFKIRKDLVLSRSILEQARMRVQVNQYTSVVKGLEYARSRQLLLRNGLIIFLVLLAIISLLVITRIQSKRKAAIELLRQAEGELRRYMDAMVEKKEVIKSFREEFEKLKISNQLEDHERSSAISTMMHSNILTDDDWKHFRQLFDAVYPGFLVRIKEKITDLTPAEMRLLALTKLKLPSKDMADILGISPESIRKTRYRLRKKLDLPEEGTLDELVNMI